MTWCIGSHILCSELDLDNWILKANRNRKVFAMSIYFNEDSVNEAVTVLMNKPETVEVICWYMNENGIDTYWFAQLCVAVVECINENDMWDEFAVWANVTPEIVVEALLQIAEDW